MPHYVFIGQRSLFLCVVLCAADILAAATGFAADDTLIGRLEQGRVVALDRSKGNCLACHQIEGGVLMGDIGPPLLMMKARFPDREILRTQIWDAKVRNPESSMPPFGRNRILTENEIDLVTDFILSL